MNQKPSLRIVSLRGAFVATKQSPIRWLGIASQKPLAMTERVECLLLILVLLAVSLFAPACATTPAASVKPNIILAAPPHGSEFREGDTVIVQSAATDSVSVARVELLVDNALVRSDSALSPQTYFSVAQSWKAIQGKHTISVRAYNTAGVASDAASISITVLLAVIPATAAPTAPATPIAPIPTPPPTLALAPVTPTVPLTATCVDNVEILAETIPDGTGMPPNQEFIKIWRLHNNGSCAWGLGYAFAFVTGEAMTSETTAPLDQSIPPDDVIDLFVPLTAPAAPGVHQGEWRMRNTNGAVFGEPFVVVINVVASPGQTELPPAEPPAAQSGMPTLPPAATLPRSVPLLPSWWLTRTPTRTPLAGFSIVPSRTPTRTPLSGFSIVPSRTPTRTPLAGFGIVPSRTPTRR